MQSEPDTYTTKTDRCSRRFGRRFSSGASRRIRAIFFFNAASDLALEGLLLGIGPSDRLPSHPRKCSLTRLQGSNEGRRAHPKSDGRSRDRPRPGNSPSGDRRMQLLARKHKPGEQDLRKNQGGHLRIRWSRLITQKWPGACEGPRRPKVVKHQDETRRRTWRPSSGVGVRVKREYVRRSDLYTSHLVILPRNRLWAVNGLEGGNLGKPDRGLGV